ncbi:MAG: HAMP domain-containing histidine kinase [Lactobacillus sp.]|jgi:signal transduction histidine kinase|nr:HAMP domain-containing histidine kinase [Lactobacillus sp.]MCI2033768.1 HAMP domain-containing histidine kinase [Lactobacillus sp.]
MTNNEPSPKRRLSLAFKWTAVVGVGIFVTFLVFSLILYGATGQILASQERSTLRDTLNAVEQRLSPIATKLTDKNVSPLLEVDGSDYQTSAGTGVSLVGGNDESVFADSVIQKLSRADVSVAVYNNGGDQIFSSRNQDQPLNKVTTTTIKQVKTNDFNGLVVTAPIVSSTTGKHLGYVQITDRMKAIHATMRRVFNMILLLSGVALLVSLLVGYIMARRFLRPIRSITKTINVVNEEPQSSVRIPELKQNDELGDLVNEFNGMLDRIQRFIDQQGDFVQDVSHELRTPVAILEGHLQLLNRWGKDDPEVLEESLSASLQEITRMKSLIQEMLDLTRADQVDVQFPNAVCDLNQILEQVVNDFKMIHPDFVFILDNDLEGSVFVRVYRNHLEQVLIILLDNAVKYSLTRKEIHISAARNSDGVALVVQDFGEGLSNEDRDRVFNRFYRVDKARSREKGGNGLGLSIAQQLVESYHGEITVDSALGHGSAFRIDLPTITEEEADHLREQAEKQPEDPFANSNL